MVPLHTNGVLAREETGHPDALMRLRDISKGEELGKYITVVLMVGDTMPLARDNRVLYLSPCRLL